MRAFGFLSLANSGSFVHHQAPCFEAWYGALTEPNALLTDTKLRTLKPKEKLYKVNDRDGLYVAVTAAGSISFRYN